MRDIKDNDSENQLLAQVRKIMDNKGLKTPSKVPV